MTEKKTGPVAKAQMLIRKPVANVFEALIDPAITTRFWFSKSSGRLEVGKRVRWDWEMYGVGTNVDVKAIEPNKRILVEWDGPDRPNQVEWSFESKGDDRTFVLVKNWGFSGEPDDAVSEAINSTEGFTFVLAALKAFLEHDMDLDLVLDHSPNALVDGWRGRSKRASTAAGHSATEPTSQSHHAAH
jgi:uncharacterized protein YndB with AHSA1/START domain